MSKKRRLSQKKENKEAIIFFCSSLKKQMLHANKKGKPFSIEMSQHPGEVTAIGSGDYIEFSEGDKMITVILELK